MKHDSTAMNCRPTSGKCLRQRTQFKQCRDRPHPFSPGARGMMTSVSFQPPAAAAFHRRPLRQDMHSHDQPRVNRPVTSPSSALPKIATGRSALSAKKLWKDHSSIDIYNAVAKNRVNAPDEPPIQVPKNPKPLYKRAVQEAKPFRILHSDSAYGSRENLPGLYAEMTFLANAVRNNDGTTSYKGMCKKKHNQTVPSSASSAPGRLEAGSGDLHWTSASNDRPLPRMLLPTSPGPITKWYAWKVESPRDTESPRMGVKPRSFIRTTRSDSGIPSRASFLHTVAEKRGQMVVSYQHNGRQHYSLVKVPEATDLHQDVANKEKGKPGDSSRSYVTGSSLVSSSYASITNASISQGNLSVRGIGDGGKDGGGQAMSSSGMKNLHAKDKVISVDDEVKDKTTQQETLDKHDQEPEQELLEQRHQQSQDTQAHDGNNSKDNVYKDNKVTVTGSDVTEPRNKGVHFADDTATDGNATALASKGAFKTEHDIDNKCNFTENDNPTSSTTTTFVRTENDDNETVTPDGCNVDAQYTLKDADNCDKENLVEGNLESKVNQQDMPISKDL